MPVISALADDLGLAGVEVKGLYDRKRHLVVLHYSLVVAIASLDFRDMELAVGGCICLAAMHEVVFTVALRNTDALEVIVQRDIVLGRNGRILCAESAYDVKVLVNNGKIGVEDALRSFQVRIVVQ